MIDRYVVGHDGFFGGFERQAALELAQIKIYTPATFSSIPHVSML